jgi:hypothetical protein
MPVLDGKFRNSSMAASNPPAEPPMPTIGQLAESLTAAVFPRAWRGLAVLKARRRVGGLFVFAFEGTP